MMHKDEANQENQDKVNQDKADQDKVNQNRVSQDVAAIVAKCKPPLRRGSCVLGMPEVAIVVQRALLHFHGDRYVLLAWCIMPNHVHIVMAPLGGHSLSDIMHSIKSFTANAINGMLRRSGPLWERESFDHLIRTPGHLDAFCLYVEDNPVGARLVQRREDWPFSSCGAGFQPAHSELGVWKDPRATRFVEMRSRGELPHLEKAGGVYFITFRLFDAVETSPRKWVRGTNGR